MIKHKRMAIQVERLRKENEWLKDEANRTKMESHEYLQVTEILKANGIGVGKMVELM